MELFKTKVALQKHLLQYKNHNKTIGFVPTMGALHQGHLSLMALAQQKTDVLVVSIFVNPTQFDNKEDLEKYPQTLHTDLQLLETIQCDVVYAPSAEDVYDGSIEALEFDFDGLEYPMEGTFRKGHFNGVGTVVKKLFESVLPDYAFFGQKDFQQLQIIKKMVEKHHIPVKIVGCPIFREADGLAMSSRNTRLTKEHRAAAPFIYQTLKEVKEKFGTENAKEISEWVVQQFKNHPLLILEYFTIADEETLQVVDTVKSDTIYRAFIAVYASDIRLIDTMRLTPIN